MKAEIEYNSERFPLDCGDIIDHSLRMKDVPPPVDQPYYRPRAGYARKVRPITHAPVQPEDCHALMKSIRDIFEKNKPSSFSDVKLIVDPEFAAVMATFYEVDVIRKDATYELNRLQGFRKEYSIEVDRDENGKPIFLGIPEQLYGVKVIIEG